MSKNISDLLVSSVLSILSANLRIRTVDHTSVLEYLTAKQELVAVDIVTAIPEPLWNSIAQLVGSIQMKESDMNKSQRILALLEKAKSSKWVVYRKKITGDEFTLLQKNGKFLGNEKDARIFPNDDEAITWIQDEGEKKGWDFDSSSGTYIDGKYEIYADFLDNANESMSGDRVDYKGWQYRVGAKGVTDIISPMGTFVTKATTEADAKEYIDCHAGKPGYSAHAPTGFVPSHPRAFEALNEEALPTKIMVTPDNWVSTEPVEVKYNDKTGRFMVRGEMYTLEKQVQDTTHDDGSKYDAANFEGYTLRGDAWSKTYKLGTVCKFKHDKEFVAMSTAIELQAVNKFAAAAKLIMNIV